MTSLGISPLCLPALPPAAARQDDRGVCGWAAPGRSQCAHLSAAARPGGAQHRLSGGGKHGAGPAVRGGGRGRSISKSSVAACASLMPLRLRRSRAPFLCLLPFAGCRAVSGPRHARSGGLQDWPPLGSRLPGAGGPGLHPAADNGGRLRGCAPAASTSGAQLGNARRLNDVTCRCWEGGCWARQLHTSPLLSFPWLQTGPPQGCRWRHEALRCAAFIM